jgi:hypothetical protein
MYKSNGPLKGYHDGTLFQINLIFGDRQRIFIEEPMKFHPDFVEVLGTALMQTQKKGEPGLWRTENEFSFSAFANLSSHR